ncbi:MAG: hypothetical protein MUC40_10810 [Akkermansiaceae bacterium]|nr:hypothetical protein [Akkermansiaceae bacterium]
MKVKMILPALTEARSPLFRPIKYSLFPPLGLATLAAYLPADADITLQDEHVEPLDLTDEPELVVIQVSASAGCMSPRCRTRPPPMRTRSFSGRARTRFRNSCAISNQAGRKHAMPRRWAARSTTCRRYAGT